MNEWVNTWMNLFSQFLVECLAHSRYGINGYTQQSKHVSISTSSSSSVFHLLRSNTDLYVLSQNPLYLMHYYFNEEFSIANNKLTKPSTFSRITKNLDSPEEPSDMGLVSFYHYHDVIQVLCVYTCSCVISIILNRILISQPIFNLLEI